MGAHDTMTPESVGPLSRPIDVNNVPPAGKHVHVRATAEECARSGEGFRPRGRSDPSPADSAHRHGRGGARGGRGEGQRSRRSASSRLDAVRFRPIEEESRSISPSQAACLRSRRRRCTNTSRRTRSSTAKIDLGAVVAEFLALGLDPYPRKPGVDFDFKDPADAEMSPFAALKS